MSKRLIRYLAGAVFGAALAGIVVAQDSFLDGSPVVLFNCTSFAGTYTPFTYTNSPAVPLDRFNTFTLRVSVASAASPAPAGKTIQFKYQWNDSTNANTWVDERVLSAGTANTTNQPYTALTRVIEINANTNINHYIERVNRMGRYFRVGMRTDGATNAVGIVYITPFRN